MTVNHQSSNDALSKSELLSLTIHNQYSIQIHTKIVTQISDLSLPQLLVQAR